MWRMPPHSCPGAQRLAGDDMAEGGSFVERNGSTRLVVSEGDLESVALLFGRITALRRRGGGLASTGGHDRDEAAPLDAHVRGVMRTMKERLASLRDGPLQDAEVIMAKHGLYSICFQELILLADDIHPGLRCALEKLRDAHESLLQDVPGIVQRTLDEYKQEVSDVRADKERDAQEAGKLVEVMTLEPSPKSVGFSWNQNVSGPAAGGKAWAAAKATAAESGEAVEARRELSLKQLHDLIASVYASKEKYDRHCVAQRLPNQTLARHLDDFLVHRYGLTSRAKAQATALRKGVEKYRDNDNAVKVFELTLRHEVDEGFQQQQRDLEKTVSEFIRSRIRERVARHEQTTKCDDRYSYRRLGGTTISRAGPGNLARGNDRQGGAGGDNTIAYPFGGAGAAASGAGASSTIETLLRSQIRPAAPLVAADWQAVLRHVYKGAAAASADAKTVGFLVKEAVSIKHEEKGVSRDTGELGSRKGAAGSVGGAGQGQGSVPYGLFLQVLLGYQLHRHLRRLEAFQEDFRKVDVDADGVLNPAQFLALAKRTMGRLRRSMAPPREQQCRPTRTIDDGSMDPGILPISVFGDSGASEFSYHDNLAAATASTASETDAFFDKGDRIPAAFLEQDEDGTGTVAAYGGYFPLPAADDTGRCNEANFAGFGIPVPSKRGEDYSCSREVEDLESQCSSVFGWARFTSQLYVATDGTAAPSPISVAGQYTPVEISSVTWRDWDTGEETDFAEVNCEAFYYDGGLEAGTPAPAASPATATATSSTTTTTTRSACILGGRGGETMASAVGVEEGCKNALVSVCYTISHDGEGSIAAVSAAVVLTDVPPGPMEGNSAAASSQRFSVEFRLDPNSDAFSEMTRSQDLGNLVDRERSGNPGYLPGLPVLAGRLESSEDFEYVAPGGSDDGGGLELMVGEGRGCEDVGTSPVEFAYDAFGCCVLSLTRLELAEHCTGSGPHVDPETGFTPLAFYNTSSSVEYLGSYGNADPLDPSQWVEIPVASSADTASWDDKSGVCSSVVSTLEYRVLYAPVGSAANPQSKIVSAAARYGKSDWIWREEASSEQNFLVCNSVSFKVFEQEGSGKI
eukprot:g12678.t1